MAEQKKDKVDVRDLKPNKDAKGGAGRHANQGGSHQADSGTGRSAQGTGRNIQQ